MDYERLKDQWSDVEERDGVRLSWNTFPSTRMVRIRACFGRIVDTSLGSFEAGCSNRSPHHSTQRKTGQSFIAI